MSLAGRRSNRGDAFQTQIAVDWAISMLVGKDIAAIETDATTITAAGPVPVDDIVILKSDGTSIYCQCKKNEPKFEDWSVKSLSDELKKAARLLLAERVAVVHFYSRSGFASLSRLREHAESVSDAAAYRTGLATENAATDAALTATFFEFSPPANFTFQFLRQTRFEQTGDFERLERHQLERLSQVVSSAPRVYEALWFTLDRAGAGLGGVAGDNVAVSRLTNRDLLTRVHQAGGIVSPPRSQIDLEKALTALSSVGREWRRDIAGTRLRRVCNDEIVANLRQGCRSILITGGPGAGKSCTTLDLIEDLARTEVLPVYVQCRVFGDANGEQERQTRGFPENFVSLVARLSEFRPITVVFDSLDVLSLSREHRALNFFLTQIDQLLVLPNVSVVASCRTFDSKYDARLSVRDWSKRVELPDLLWEEEILPLLVQSGVDESAIGQRTRTLIGNPRHLAMFLDIVKRGHLVVATTHQELSKAFLDVAVTTVPELGDEALHALERIAADMLFRRSLEIGRDRANLPARMEPVLLSNGVLQRTSNGTFEFSHQTLLDVLAIAGWERKGGNLQTFIEAMPQVPFIRPAVRAYVLEAAVADRPNLRRVLRAIASSTLPHHIRRLVFETFAELEPVDEDWGLLNSLRQHPGLFEPLFARASSFAWHKFWLRYLAPISLAERDENRLELLAARAGESINGDTDGVIEFWNQVLGADWFDGRRAAMSMQFALAKYSGAANQNVQELIKRLLLLPRLDYDAMGGAILQAVRTGNATAETLWAYITGDLTDEAIGRHAIDEKLRCDAHIFGEGLALAEQMTKSVPLLDLGIGSLRHWVSVFDSRYQPDAAWTEGFLQNTSYSHVHTRHDISHNGPLSVVVMSIETAVLHHARLNSDWWMENKRQLAASRDGAQRYWVVRALTENVELDLGLVVQLACEREMLTYSLAYEMSELVRVAMPLLPHDDQDKIVAAIRGLPETDPFAVKDKCFLVKAIPAPFRPPDLSALLEREELLGGAVIREPRIHSFSGGVPPPFGFERFLERSDREVVKLLHHYAKPTAREWGELMGGPEEVGHQLREAVSRAPLRFLSLLQMCWVDVPDRFREDILDGCSQHAEHLFGSMQYDKARWVPIETPDAETLSGLLLDELERHSIFWWRKRESARALRAVSEMVSASASLRVAFLMFQFLDISEREMEGNLRTAALNSSRGRIAEGAICLAISCDEENIQIPGMLLSLLRLLAGSESESVRTSILDRLPYFISRQREIGWDLFGVCMTDASLSLWKLAEHCLYWSYRTQFNVMRGYLDTLRAKCRTEVLGETGSNRDDFEKSAWSTWARISTLASLAGNIPQDHLLASFRVEAVDQVWKSAAVVWAANAHRADLRDACISGLRAVIAEGRAGHSLASALDNLFDHRPAISVPDDLIAALFAAQSIGARVERHYHPHQFAGWLEALAFTRPDETLSALEQLSMYVSQSGQRIYDSGHIARVLTSLFREAEEREQEDSGAMLGRLVAIQDSLFAVSVHGLDEWLRAAERP